MDFLSGATSHLVARFGLIPPLESALKRGSKKIHEVGPPQLGSGIQPILAEGKNGSPYLRVTPYLGVTVAGAVVVVAAGVAGFEVVGASVVVEALQPIRSKLIITSITGTIYKYFFILPTTIFYSSLVTNTLL